MISIFVDAFWQHLLKYQARKSWPQFFRQQTAVKRKTSRSTIAKRLQPNDCQIKNDNPIADRSSPHWEI